MNENLTPERAAPLKKRYSSPTVEKVSLRAEEAVLGFCKNSNGGGPRGTGCQNVGKCATQGS